MTAVTMNPILLNRCLVDTKTNEIFNINGDGEIAVVTRINNVATVDELTARYNELRLQGIKLKSNPVTKEDKELHNIYYRLRYRSTKK